METRKAERTTHLSQGEEILANISETGACLRLPESPAVGSEIKLEMSSKHKSVSLAARVVRTKAEKGGKTHQVGIHFIRLLESQTALIREIVEDFGRGVPIRIRLTG